KLELLPKVSADSKTVSLATHVQFTEVKDAVKLPVTKKEPGVLFPVTTFEPRPLLNTWTARETKAVSFGGSLVFASVTCDKCSTGTALKSVGDREPNVMLLIVTPVGTK